MYLLITNIYIVNAVINQLCPGLSVVLKVHMNNWLFIIAL